MAESAVKDRVVYPLQKRVINPIVMLAHNLGFPPPGDALLETTGRRTGPAGQNQEFTSGNQLQRYLTSYGADSEARFARSDDLCQSLCSTDETKSRSVRGCIQQDLGDLRT